ncbi:MAG TPA: FAD binding domain-containing protein [Ilumatobacteraceae bacterium]|nr:FAD binding domain-containing protein [Ilumatobacteraceae bacterium]HRB02660.1 FAD binding domain-containing protein [Ilumatobacteraceae bacterium]
MSFLIAQSVEEALSALAAGARPIAGGTDLVVSARHGKAPLPEALVSIDRLAELTTITETEHGISIGALVTHHSIESHPLLTTVYAGLADGSALVGSPSTRHMGTLGGNLMNGSPAMDTGAALQVLDAEVELRSVRGSRRIAIASLWARPGQTTAAADELCVAIHIPRPASASGSAYLRLEYRRAMEIAVVGAAASVTLGDGGTVGAVSVALTAVAPVILGVTDLQSVVGLSVAEAAAAIQELAAAQATPISDVRASDRYRRHTVGVMARRAVEAAARRASGEVIAIPVNRAIGIGAAS